MPHSKTLRKFLKDKGLKQAHIAQKMGITASHLSRILNGKATPNLITTIKLATVLGITTDELIELSGEAWISQ